MIATYEPGLNGPLVAGVDVGGTKTSVVVTDVGGTLYEHVTPTDRSSLVGQSRIARERAASPLVQAALGDATVELLSPTEEPGARGAAAIARHRIGLPEREGVGER